MTHRTAMQREVRELTAVATLPCLYIVAAPLLSVTPIFDPVTIVGGPVLAMLVMIGAWGAWSLRPRRTAGGWTIPAGDQSLLRALWQGARSHRVHWLRGLFLMALALAFLDVYAAYKQAIPRFADYDWDPLLSELDRLAHGGVYPWHILSPLLESQRAMIALDGIYWLWPAVTLAFVAIMAWAWDRQLRIRFMFTFFATWIIGGTIMAAALASGGPVYFHHFAPDAVNPYERLITALHEMEHLWAVHAHHLLWTGFSTGGHPRASGISAMPSLHVAMATLCVFGASTFGRVAGVLTAIYAGLIIIGSVILGWHYAIDAYVSIALVALLWWLAGRIAAGVEPTSAVEPGQDAVRARESLAGPGEALHSKPEPEHPLVRQPSDRNE